jgi:phosphocarrier protein
MENCLEQKSIEVMIVNELGMHARAAAAFVKVASMYDCDIKVEKDGLKANGKSIMGVMMLAAPKGSTIKIHACGENSEEAINALKELIHNKFGEEK